MDLGFETIGNACLICHDGGPVLATDPWFRGTAYFGSWITSHEIPEEQIEQVKACRYVWISHGHPDHLSRESLEELRGCEILLPDHHGGRIARDLAEAGFRIRILPDGVWTELSDRTSVLSIADVRQDAILLVNLGGHLIVNANDASDHGAGPFVARTIRDFEDTFLLCLTGYGDADMINFYDEGGNFLPPPAMDRVPFIEGLDNLMRVWGVRHFVPFSSLHAYQRTDSAWANQCATPAEAYQTELPSSDHILLPAFCRYDLARGEVSSIDPPRRPETLHAPEEFGDDWSDELEGEDVRKIQSYFDRVSHLRTFLGFVNFRVGGKDNRIDVNPREFERGITFATPRQSLMTVVEQDCFDDLLIGNFTRTTLHGDWDHTGTAALYPDFIPFVTKYGDNGGAYSPEQLEAYFAAYKARGFFGFTDDESGRLDARALAPYLR